MRQLNSLILNLKYKYMPRIANCMCKMATYTASRELRRKRIRILADVTIFQHAVTHETAWVNTGLKPWGDGHVATGYQARTCVHSGNNTNITYRNITYLPGIAYLAQKDLLEIYTSAELEAEKHRQPGGRFRGYGYYDFSLLKCINVESVDGHVFDIITGSLRSDAPSAAERQKNRINGNRDPQFRGLVEALGQSNSFDAWHLLTAERNDCDYYLTMDFRFLETCKAQRNSRPLRKLKAEVVSPEGLAKKFSILPVNPNIFSYNDASYPVQTEFHMPGEKRRPLTKYRKS